MIVPEYSEGNTMEQKCIVSIDISGDSGNSYTITTERNHSGKISMKCTCPAGEMETLCKHRLDILEGNFKRVDDASKYKIDELQCILLEHNFKIKIQEYFNELSRLEKNQKEIKKQISNLKKKFGKALGIGI